MKASWSGYLRLGKLTIPVRLYSATRSLTPNFVQLHAKDHSPVKRILTCQKEGKKIDSDEIIRAVEHGGEYVELSEAELKASQDADKSITVSQFSDPLSINPMYYEKPYYVVPAKGGELAYTLLREAFVRAKKVAVALFMLYEKQHLGIVQAHDGIIMLQQLRYADEIVPRSDIKTVSLPQPTPSQVDLATQLVERYSAPLYIEDFHNDQREQLKEVIERKAKGLPPKRQPRVAPQTTSEDELTATLISLVETQKPRHLLNSDYV